ncbi:hypothetical protein KAJ87_04430 [Candidatus Pacearchaeota archaeon]|nr:hypothetical protein [Candidatus Pacearchaeota archaeon]
MILLISTCKEKFHELEFVKPIEKILSENKISFFTKHHKEITKSDLNKTKKIILSGTSLKDNHFLKDLKNFEWIKETNKPLLGICAGMQIIGLLFNGKLRNKKEIGFYKEDFKKEFLGLKGEQEVYHLHHNYTILPKDFIKFTKSKIPQAIKHKEKKIYGVLFHPEVRNKELILNFVK